MGILLYTFLNRQVLQKLVTVKFWFILGWRTLSMYNLIIWCFEFGIRFLYVYTHALVHLEEMIKRLILWYGLKYERIWST